MNMYFVGFENKGWEGIKFLIDELYFILKRISVN